MTLAIKRFSTRRGYYQTEVTKTTPGFFGKIMKPPNFFNERWASKGPRPPTYFDTIGSYRLFRYNNN